MAQDKVIAAPGTIAENSSRPEQPTNGNGAQPSQQPAPHQKAGLEDVIAGTSKICYLDGKKGVLAYYGYNIHDLVKGSFEETAYLLFNGKLPNSAELTEFKAKLLQARKLPSAIKDRIRELPKNIHPMAVLRTIVSELGVYDTTAEEMSPQANIEKGIRMMAQIPLIIAHYDSVRNGRQPLESKNELDHAANFLYLLLGKDQDARVVKMFDAALTLHADHELNASTFTGRVIAATLSDIYSAVVGAIGALKGPLHGGANEQVMRMLLKISDPANATNWITDALARKEKIMGFGHRVYRTEDPRATHLRKFSEEMGERMGEPQWYQMSRTVEEFILREKHLYPNVDFYSASTYYLMGIPLDLYTPIFAMSRITGWVAHILEQYSNNRLIRPMAEYEGAIDMVYVPISGRG